MDSVFTQIYENNYWGNNGSKNYKGSSGEGSGVDYNKDTYVPFLKKFIKDNNVKTVVDLGCGDFRCGKMIYDDLDVSYTGYDGYKKIIDYNASQHPQPKYNFIHMDFCNNVGKIVGGDMCILKDVLQHWPLTNINAFLDYLVENKIFKYILIINCGYQNKDNTDIQVGGWHALSANYLPLKKYAPRILYTYQTKEVSVISENVTA